MDKDNLISVFGCSRCKKLAGDLRAEYVTETRQGYEVCPICQADLDYFWINLIWMKFQDARSDFSLGDADANEVAQIKYLETFGYNARISPVKAIKLK